jgi:hypothetical protein
MKLILILLLCLTPFNSVFSQSVSQLNSRDRRIFDSQKLDVSSSVHRGRTKLTFYRGFDTITESEFYRIAGRTNEYREAQLHNAELESIRTIERGLNYTAAGFSVLSVMGTLMDNEDLSRGALIGSLVIVPFWLYYRISMNNHGEYRFFYSNALAVANEYNQELLESFVSE